MPRLVAVEKIRRVWAMFNGGKREHRARRRSAVLGVCLIAVIAQQSVTMSPPAAAAPSLSAELPLATPTSGPAPEHQDRPILTAVADHFAAVYFDQRIGGLAALDIGTDGAVQSTPAVPLGIAGSSFDVAFNGSRFLVVYSGFGNHYAELFDTAFSPIGDPVVVGSYNPGVGSPEPVVAAAGSEFMVAWSAYDGTSLNVWARRVAGDGTLPDGAPIVVSAAAHTQDLPDIVSTGSGYVVAWRDTRAWNGTGFEGFAREIRAARVGTDGIVADPDGVVLVESELADRLVIAASGAKVAVFFRGAVPGTSNGFGIVLASLDLATVGSPIRVGNSPSSSYLDVTLDGAAFRLAWHDFSFFTGASTLQTRRIDDTGTFVDAALVLKDDPLLSPVKTATIGSTTLVLHADQAGGDTHLYGRRLSGATVLDEQWFLLNTGASSQGNPSIAWDGEQFFSVWEHCCGGTTGNDIHGGFFDADGAPIGQEVAISAAVTSENEPRVAFDGTRFLVVWREISSGGRSLKAARVATDGTVLDATPVTVASGLNPQEHEVVWDGTTFVVAWDGLSTPGVRAARVGTDGSVLDSTPILVASGFSFLGGIASDGSGSMIAYQDPSGWRRLAPLDNGVVGTPIDVAFWQFTSPGTLTWSGAEYLVTASRFGRRVTGAGVVVGSQMDFGVGSDVADAAWHGTHWVTLVRAGGGASGFAVSARIVTASGNVLQPVAIGSVPNGSVAVPFSAHPGIGMDIAAGPANRLAIVTHRRDTAVGEGTYQSYMRFFDSVPTVSVTGSNVNEGSAGTTNASFTVRLTPPSNEAVTLSYTTVAGTASAGDDYEMTSGSLTFEAGESTKTVAVPIVGDQDIEEHETFFLWLTDITGATPGFLESGPAFILNDDFDTDGDGLPDDRDPDEIGEIVTALPRQSIGNGNRKAFLDRLEQIETLIVVGDLEDAIDELRSLRQRVNGCNGTTQEKADKNDWVSNCADQRAIRQQIDALIATLSA